jgi:hypothetical protein
VSAFENLERLCVNAEPTYGVCWSYCREDPSDSSKKCLRNAKAKLIEMAKEHLRQISGRDYSSASGTPSSGKAGHVPARAGAGGRNGAGGKAGKAGAGKTGAGRVVSGPGSASEASLEERSKLIFSKLDIAAFFLGRGRSIHEEYEDFRFKAIFN